MTARQIAVLPGDGIGPEIVEQAVKVLHAVEQRFGLSFALAYGDIGGAALDKAGVPLPEDTLRICQGSQAVFLGAVGTPRYDGIEPARRPEQGLLGIRKALGLYANLRPVQAFAPLVAASTLKPEVVEGIDMMIVRELTGGLYFGQPKGRDGDTAIDTMRYNRSEIERIARVAFDLAQQRRKHVTSVDKANVLATSQLWREVVEQVARDYPHVTVEHMYVDNAAMQLVLRPAQFDVLLTENTFGDILSDEASMLLGSLGMLASASLGGQQGLYEPSHGSAPTLAGMDQANPLATILSLAMMLELSFGEIAAARAVEAAVHAALADGLRTADLAAPGEPTVGTRAMGDAVAERVLKIAVPA